MEHSEDWTIPFRGAERLAENLSANRNMAFLCRRLATLRRDVAIQSEPRCLEWREASRKQFEPVAEKLSEPAILDRVHRWSD